MFCTYDSEKHNPRCIRAFGPTGPIEPRAARADSAWGGGGPPAERPGGGEASVWGGGCNIYIMCIYIYI